MFYDGEYFFILDVIRRDEDDEPVCLSDYKFTDYECHFDPNYPITKADLFKIFFPTRRFEKPRLYLVMEIC